MLTHPAIQVRQATLEENALIAEHFYQMWLDNEVPVEAIEANWLDIVMQFLNHAYRELDYQAFVAEVDRRVVGSASCQLFAGLYPNIIKAKYRRQGYIWGVYVEPEYRKQGIATTLTEQAIAYLKSIGCTYAVLNASPFGKPIYSRLGFVESNSMRLDLS